MGSSVSALIFTPNANNLFVDDIHPIIGPGSTGFTWSVFKRMEWSTLKLFCNKNDIHQADLAIVFKRFLTYEEVYITKFMVRTKDVMMHYALCTKLEQELAAVFIPLMFMKDFPGIEIPSNPNEISFSRFVIMSYLFAAQQIPDFIHDFIAILRQKLALNIQATILTYSFEQLLLVLMENLQPSAAVSILRESIHKFPMEDDISILHIVMLGIKYPLLFYSLERFRKRFKRLVFGEYFWHQRKCLKLRIDSYLKANNICNDFNELYRNETTALMVTARSIINDAIRANSSIPSLNSCFKISDVYNDQPVLSIDKSCCIILKNLFGYEKSRQLIVDSELPLDNSSDNAAAFVCKAFGLQAPIKKPISVLSYLPSSIHDNFAPGTTSHTNNNMIEQATISFTEEQKSHPHSFSSSGNNSCPYQSVIPPALQMVIFDPHTGSNFKYDTTSGQSLWYKNTPEPTNYGDEIDYEDDEYSEIEEES